MVVLLLVTLQLCEEQQILVSGWTQKKCHQNTFEESLRWQAYVCYVYVRSPFCAVQESAMKVSSNRIFSHQNDASTRINTVFLFSAFNSLVGFLFLFLPPYFFSLSVYGCACYPKNWRLEQWERHKLFGERVNHTIITNKIFKYGTHLGNAFIVRLFHFGE